MGIMSDDPLINDSELDEFEWPHFYPNMEYDMKIYVVTQESEYDGWTGTMVFASREAAAAHLNENITEFNDEEGTTMNKVIWPERQHSMRITVGPYTYHCEEDTLNK